MGNPLNIRDRNDQQTNDLELFTYNSDYLDVDELSASMCQQSNLNIIQLNVRGLLSKQSQINDLITRIEKSLEIHALILCETWLTSEIKNLIKINNFTYSGVEGEGRKGGGQFSHTR